MKRRYLVTQQKFDEQIKKINEELKDLIEEKSRKRWNKFFGDVCVRLFREFVSKEIPSIYTLSAPYAYIKGLPTEFDLLIVNESAKPRKYTNMYDPKDIKIGFEIKAQGVRDKRENLEKHIRTIKDRFDAVKSRYPHIDFIYFTYEEVAFPKRKTSIRYLEETIRILAPYKVFCLRDSRTRKLIDGEWEKLATFLNNSLQRGGN